MVDADYCFRYIDVGIYGRASDSTIFKVSTLNIAFEKMFSIGRRVVFEMMLFLSEQTY